MGPRSATRQAAAVAIQCWIRHRLGVTHCMQLLGLLHIIRQETQSTEDASLFRTLASGEAGSDTQSDPKASAALLRDLAVSYGARLQQENYTRRLLLESYADQLCGASDAARQAVQQHRGIRRLALLPRALLREVFEELRGARDCGGEQQRAAQYLFTLNRSACNALARASEANSGVIARGIASALQANAVPHTTERIHDPNHSNADDPNHSNADDQNNNNADDPNDNNADDPNHNNADDPNHSNADDPNHSNADEDDVVVQAESGQSAAEASESSGSDTYDDDTYYARQRAREKHRMDRISSALHMTQTDKPDDSAACETFMQTFGDVDSVAFPVLAAGHMKSTSSREACGAARCCAVCELGGSEADEEFVVCSCGKCVHSECAEKFSNDEMRCSRFCKAVI